MITLNLANINDQFQIKQFNLSEKDIESLGYIGISVGTVLTVKKIAFYLEKPGLIVKANGINVCLNNHYINNIYGEVLEKGKQFVKTR